MPPTALDPQGMRPSFCDASGPLPPVAVQREAREVFYHLVNIEEHPEVLPLAYDVVTARLARGEGEGEGEGADARRAAGAGEDPAGGVDALVASLARRAGGYRTPWRRATADQTRRQALYYLLQYMPTALVDGCWLQCGLRVSTAHTPVGASITGLYAHQVRAFITDPGRHFVADYRAAYARLGTPLEEVSSRTFAARTDFDEGTFSLPIFLLAIAQFTRSFPGEILGVNLAWQHLDLSAFGPALIKDVCEAYALPSLSQTLDEAEYFERARTMAREAVDAFIDQHAPGAERAEAWAAVRRGAQAASVAWDDWYGRIGAAAPAAAPDPRQEMLDLLWRKAPHANGYHSQKQLVTTRIDDALDPAKFDGPALLDELASSRFVKPGRAERSAMLKHLVKFGGPMMAVFSPVELEIIERWIDSLPGKETDEGMPAPAATMAAPAPSGPSVRAPELIAGRAWSKSDFQQRSARLHGTCTTRDLFYFLTNVEHHPEILPIAEQYARDRLERSMAMLWKGERPIPADRYDPAALEGWVYRKHREQVDSYRPPDVRPPAGKEAFIEATVQLAPIVLIDGAWLQGIASPALIHTVVGRMLFHVMIEEIGAGNSAEHHANIYRELLASMGENAPPVNSREFAHWSRLRDSSFDVPTLWLAISCFPRHFLPEILGLNLAVEIAGIGGPYMEARDTLKRFGYPTLFVDVHNAADNVAAGHSAWAMNSIRRYLDEVAEREGPHSIDHAWHRVWAGVRATLPQIGRLRLMAHRIGRRLFGEDPSLVPLIFPS